MGRGAAEVPASPWHVQGAWPRSSVPEKQLGLVQQDAAAVSGVCGHRKNGWSRLHVTSGPKPRSELAGRAAPPSATAFPSGPTSRGRRRTSLSAVVTPPAAVTWAPCGGLCAPSGEGCWQLGGSSCAPRGGSWPAVREAAAGRGLRPGTASSAFCGGSMPAGSGHHAQDGRGCHPAVSRALLAGRTRN